MLIVDYLNLPKTGVDPYKPFGVGEKPFLDYNPYFWTISVGDQRISNIENYIISLLFVYGFLKIIDFLFLIEKYKNN